MAIHASAPLRHVRAMDPVVARRAVAVFVAAHAIAHLVGTTRSFSHAADGGSLDYLVGKWTISDPATLRILGVLWAAMAVAFLVAAAVMWAGRARWPRLLWWVSLASLLLALLALWASVIGVLVDLVLLAIAWRAGARSA